jgi:alkyl sulfatase BDS1-like metallo-beta-lactamase superfamily hydrolase
MGGADAVLRRAREAYAQGDYRWVAQIGNQLVFADPGNRAARELQADALEQLGYGSENSTWRNAYLTGAQELRAGVASMPRQGTASADIVGALTVPMFFDYLAVRLNADKAAGKTMAINWEFTDLHEKYAMTLENSALTYLANSYHPQPTASVSLERATLTRIATGQLKLPDAMKSGAIRVSGEPGTLGALFGMLDSFTPSFNIVTPVAQP